MNRALGLWDRLGKTARKLFSGKRRRQRSAKNNRRNRFSICELLEERQMLSASMGFQQPVYYLNANSATDQMINVVASWDGTGTNTPVYGAAISAALENPALTPANNPNGAGPGIKSIDMTGTGTLFNIGGTSHGTGTNDLDGVWPPPTDQYRMAEYNDTALNNFNDTSVVLGASSSPSLLGTLAITTQGYSYTNGYDTSHPLTLTLTPYSTGIWSLPGTDSYLVLRDLNQASVGGTATVYINNQPIAGMDGGTNHSFTVNEQSSVTLHGGTSLDHDSADTLSYLWQTSSDGGTNWGNAATTTDFTYSAGPPGTVKVKLTVTDNHGYASTSVLGNITVNNAPPTVSLGNLSAIYEGDTLTIGTGTGDGNYSIADVGGEAGNLTVNWGDGTSNYSAAYTLGSLPTLPTHTYAQDSNLGNFTVTLTATDSLGGVGTASKTLSVRNVAPSAPGSLTLSATTINEGGNVTLSGSFTDPGTLDTHTVKINWGDGTANSTVGLAANVLNFTSPSHQYVDEGTGSYTISVTVADDDVTGSSDTATVAVQNVAPTVVINGSATALEGGNVALTATVNDPGVNDVLTRTWSVTKDGSSYGSTSSAATFSFIPTDNGNYAVTLNVTDGDGGGNTTTKPISVTNVAPTIGTLTLSATTINEGQSVTLNGNVSDPGWVQDTGSLTINWGDGSGNTTISYTPAGTLTPFSGSHTYANQAGSGASGAYTISIRATDKDNAQGAFGNTSVTVKDLAPAITSGALGNQTVTLGSLATLAPGIAFTDAGLNDSHATSRITWGDGTTDTLPVTETSGSGTLSGAAHAYSSVGTYTATVIVSDSEGLSANQTFNVTVNNATVAARKIFYNNCFFDGDSAALNANDDNAIALQYGTSTAMVALLPGQVPSRPSVSNYTKGINGIMIDIQGLSPTRDPQLGDFDFRAGTDFTNPSAWAPVSGTAIAVRRGAGVGGADRVEIAFADNSIRNTWLQVTAMAAPLGLANNDVFYFGNAWGDTDTTGSFVVNAIDELRPVTFVSDPANLNDLYNVNRDGVTGTGDRIAIRGAKTTATNLALPTLSTSAAPNVLTISAPTATAEGANGNTTQFPFVVSLSQPLASSFNFTVTTAAGTATSPSDYTSITGGTFTFPANKTSFVVNVIVSGDAVTEAAETFSVNISGALPSGVVYGRASAQATILDGSGLTAVTDYAATNANAILSGSDLKSNDTGGVAPRSVVAATTTSARGAAVTINGNGTFSYDPTNATAAPTLRALPAGATATDTFSYTVRDSGSQTATGLAVITVTGVNDVPTLGGASTGSVTEDGTLPITATGALTISDPDTGQSTFVAQSAGTAAHGTFALAANGNWTYTLNNDDAAVQALAAGATLSDSFIATSFDGTATRTVTITITGVNDVPTLGGDDTGSVTEDGTLPITATGALTISDTDTGESTYLAQTAVDTTYGSVTLGTDGNWTYTLNNDDAAVQALAADATLSDSFIATSFDGTATRTVTITITGVNDVPTLGGDDTGSVTEDGTLPITATGALTISDTDTGESTYVAQTAVDTTYGSVTLGTDGNWTYTLNNDDAAVQALAAGATLSDSFIATSFDGTATRTVTITITGVNDVPTLGGDDTGSVTEDGTLPITATGALTISDTDTGESTYVAQTAVDTTYGSVTLGTDGNWTYTLNNADAAVQALAADATLSDSFIATSFDGTATRTVTITITGVNDVPTLGGVNAGSVTEDATLPITATGALTISDTDTGESTYLAQTAVDTTYGSVTLGTDGNWTYTLNNADAAVQALADGATLSDSFIATSFDGTATRTVTITITGVNDVPTLGGVNVGSVTEDGTLPITATGALTISDTDTGESTYLAQSAVATTHGSVTLGTDGNWTYTLNNADAAVQALAADATLSDSFIATSFDGTATRTVTITITGVNDVPTLGGVNAGSVTEDATLPITATGALTISDTDTGESTYLAQTAVDTTYGSVTLGTDGNWTYTLNNADAAVQALADGATLSDSFIATSFDGTATRTVTITITGANDAPTFISSAAPNVLENTTYVVALSATDIDVPPQTVTYTLDGGTGADQDKFQITSGNQLSFITAPNYEALGSAAGTNVYVVDVTADDGAGGTTVQTISVTVTDVSAPVFTSSATPSVEAGSEAVVVTLAAITDPSGLATFSKTGGADAALFQITGNQLTFVAGAAPAYTGVDDVYEVQVTADDGFGNTTVQTISVTVTQAAGPSFMAGGGTGALDSLFSGLGSGLGGGIGSDSQGAADDFFAKLGSL